MSAPMMRGSDVAPMLRHLQKRFGSRLYRTPVAEMKIGGVSPDDLTNARLRLLHDRKWTSGECSDISLALEAIENYYRAIGATWDARRLSDLRFDVGLVWESAYRQEQMCGLAPAGCRFEGSCDCESHAMGVAWERAMPAFANALWAGRRADAAVRT